VQCRSELRCRALVLCRPGCQLLRSQVLPSAPLPPPSPLLQAALLRSGLRALVLCRPELLR